MILHPIGFWADSDAAGVVTLSGGSNTAFRFGADALAYFYLNADGTVDSQDNADAPIQVSPTTDWVIPNSAAPGSYRGKHSSITGDTTRDGGTLSATYAALTTTKYWYVTDTDAGGPYSITFTMHIDDGTTEQDTGSYTLTATRENF